MLRGEVRAKAREPELLVLTKANATATVHRGELLDYVGIKTFDRRGRVNGEHRFLGLWTSTAYHSSPRDIPVLRHKVDRVIEHFGLDPASHDGKEVLNVLETYPRDELFQANVPDLIRIVRGVVNLYERRTVRLLVRRDPYHRFYSCLVYVPRDRYNTEVRERIEAIAREGFAGTGVESQAQISGASHARVHVVVRTDPAQERKPDFARIERRIAEAALTWSDRLREFLVDRLGEAKGLALAARYRQAFPLAYEEDVAPTEVLEDLNDLEALLEQPRSLRLNLYRPPGQVLQRLHLKILKLGEPVPISDVLPMLENFGLRVIAERPYELVWPAGGAAWIQDFELEHRDRLVIEIERIEAIFRDAFGAAWSGAVENDGFNRLLLAAELNARQVVMLRAYCRYLLQTGAPFSQAYMERTLTAHPVMARHLVHLFEARFDPGVQRQRGNERRAVSIVHQIRTGLDAVSSLDDDRILRAYLTLVQATLRTNFYQRAADGEPKPYVSFKFDPAKIPDLPLPRPKYEIFVYSPRVEGVHLRMGNVARGGIRWSDRREDFRTEVLGLMKAQNVKNTLIVPVGAKGGFVPKRLPASGTREEVQAEVVACYQTFIRALLDLTDNIVSGRIVPPKEVVRSDGDDPYLVVAADKGTATFSDIANAIAAEYHFWLGDAFASGGSAGYDHKKMGITARGAWECVKRHFREMGIDTQRMHFTVAGIGDMSGDVFGNGMLLSRHIRLQAAFDHRHIFLDPDPHTVVSYAERARLFALPRSSWDDYDQKTLSRGGGIYPRSAKSIALSSEVRALLGIESSTAAPNEVIRAILRMPVDLLWNGGIGTYVKASDERNAEVGDRTNDAVRVDGRELRARVVGEGGNLGLTQRGRVEYALHRGRLNTDFIDNSAGVNTSDVEVNIKILLNPLVHEGHLRRAERNRLARAHDPRGRRPGAAQQLPAEPGHQHARAAVDRAPAGVPAPHSSARALGRAQPRARVPADGRGTHRAPQARRGTDAAGARALARLQQDLAERPPAAVRRARGPVPLERAGALLPQADPGALPARDRPPPAAARDHRHRDHQQRRQPHGADLRVARPGRHRGGPGADRALLQRGARDLRHARGVGADRSARQQGDGEPAVRGRLPDQPPAAPRHLLAARQAHAPGSRRRGGGVPRRRAAPGGADPRGAHRRGAAALRGGPQALRRGRPAAGTRAAHRQPRGAECGARHLRDRRRLPGERHRDRARVLRGRHAHRL